MVEVFYRIVFIVLKVFNFIVEFDLIFNVDCKVMIFWFKVICVVVFVFLVGIVLDCKNYIINLLKNMGFVKY